MKIKGEFILREIGGDTILVPVGKTALIKNCMITLDEVGTIIWKAIESGKTLDDIVGEIVQNYEVDSNQAKEDLHEFIQNLKQADLLEE